MGAAFAAMAIGLNWIRVSADAATASISTGLFLNLSLELANRLGVVPFVVFYIESRRFSHS